MLLPETPRGDAFQAIDERGECHLGRILHEEMHMIIFAVRLNQDGFKVLTDFGKDGA